MKRSLPIRSFRFALVALFVAGGLLLWGELAPVDGVVSFRLPPSVKTAKGSIRRGAWSTMAIVVRNAEGEVAARAEQDLGEGLNGPVTPPISLRLPRGDYLALATLSTPTGATGALAGKLTLTDTGYHRVDLQPLD